VANSNVAQVSKPADAGNSAGAGFYYDVPHRKKLVAIPAWGA
jgi:hypothetical protein